MKVQEIMTHDPACCTPDEPLKDVARKMVDCDCGEIPVVDGPNRKHPVGVITDRDITCRTVAEGRNPLEMTARDAMSQPVITVTPDTDIEDCIDQMERHQIRRIPVVDKRGTLCGIIAQSDIALSAGENDTASVVREVSQPTHRPSQPGR